LAKKNFAVAGKEYVELLRANGGKYSKAFKKYKWKNQLKGIDEIIIKYYGKKFKQN